MKGRYALEQARRQWNRLAKDHYSVPRECRADFRYDCERAHAHTGERRIEIPHWAARSGHAEVIEF